MKEILIQKIKKYSNKVLSKHIKSTDLYDKILDNTTFLNNCTLSERIYCIINDITSIKKCYCGKGLKFKSLTDGYSKFCSNKCSNSSEQTKNKIKKTNIKKYGVDNPFKSIDIKNKIKKTNIKKYGVDNPFKNKKIQDKCQESNPFIHNKDFVKRCFINKYGVENTMHVNKFKTKQRETMRDKYGVEFPFQIPKVKDNMLKKSFKTMYNSICNFDNITPLFNLDNYNGSYKEYKWKCDICNSEFTDFLRNGNRPICKVCNPILSSKPQSEILSFLSNQNVVLSSNNRNIIQPLELDFYISDKKLAIEFDGIYWHSELNGKNRNYHLNKTNLCNQNNIKLIHIFEDEWNDKKNIVKARLRHILGKTNYNIYGRKCIIKEIDVNTKNKFLNKYHIQGSDISKIKLGAFYKNKLIAVMTFGKRKITGSYEINWELIRYATISTFNCIGVASKLLKYFEKLYSPTKLITYADRRWSEGNMYYKLGFSLDHISKPNYWYTKNYRTRFNRLSFRKHTLKNKLEKFDPNLSEWQNMKLNGWDRIWDCGNLVFIKHY